MRETVLLVADWSALIIVVAFVVSNLTSNLCVSPTSTSETFQESCIAPAETVVSFLGAIISAGNGAWLESAAPDK